jgi:hypothetical protein
MFKILKVASILSCAFVLALGLSSVTMAIDNSLAAGETKDADARKGIHTMKGEVLRLEPDLYVIKRSDGKQVSLHIDETTKVTRTFAPGEWIEAKVVQYNDGHYALSINPVK